MVLVCSSQRWAVLTKLLKIKTQFTCQEICRYRDIVFEFLEMPDRLEIGLYNKPKVLELVNEFWTSRFLTKYGYK